MSEEKVLLEKWFRGVWIEEDLGLIDEVFEFSTITRGILPRMTLGKDDYKEFVTMVLQLVQVEALEMVLQTQENHWVQSLYQVKLSPRHGGNSFEVTGHTSVRFDNGKMVEAYNNFDFFSLFEELGQLPEMALGLCLSGQALA